MFAGGAAAAAGLLVCCCFFATGEHGESTRAIHGFFTGGCLCISYLGMVYSN